MAPTIRIDDEVYAWLQQQAKAFEDTPNSVLRRIAGIDSTPEKSSPKKLDARDVGDLKGDKTPQWAYRKPILRALKKLGGKGARTQVLEEIEAAIGDRFTKADKAKIKSGAVRWQKTLEYEILQMRMERLLRPVPETARGVWALTEKGQEAARGG